MSAIKVVQPSTTEQLDHVRNLLRTFINWHLSRHTEDQELINEYFDTVSFAEELIQLPGKYVYPEGALFLAYCDNLPAGCVALRRIDSSSCEMKRMFVYQNFHGKGIGKILGAVIIEEAKKLGYKSMKLDTSFRQVEAQKLYQSFGFRIIEPYYDLPAKLKNWLVFMELMLQ